MIAAVRADELKQARVTAFETAVRNAGLLAPQDRRSAMARLTCGRERVYDVPLGAQPQVTMITGPRSGGGRTSKPSVTGHAARVSGTAHLPHHQGSTS
jgi:hypothetical protein